MSSNTRFTSLRLCLTYSAEVCNFAAHCVSRGESQTKQLLLRHAYESKMHKHIYRWILNVTSKTFIEQTKFLQKVSSCSSVLPKSLGSLIEIPWFNTPASDYSRTWHHGQYFWAKTGNDELIPRFGWQFFGPYLAWNIDHIKETVSKGNIWGPFYIPKCEGSGGG